MRYFLIILTLVGLVCSCSVLLAESRVNVPDPQDSYWSSRNLRAYFATGPDGRRVFVVTNLDNEGNRIDGRHVSERSNVRVHSESTFSKPGQPSRIIPYSEPRQPSRVVPYSKPTQPSRIVPYSEPTQPSRVIPEEQPEIEGGIPVCYWKGRIISPIRAGNRLVCPSESAPYATAPSQ